MTGPSKPVCYPLARRESPAEGRRPEGVGANIDRRLVHYHAKCMRIQSRIEFIYIYTVQPLLTDTPIKWTPLLSGHPY